MDTSLLCSLKSQTKTAKERIVVNFEFGFRTLGFGRQSFQFRGRTLDELSNDEIVREIRHTIAPYVTNSLYTARQKFLEHF